MKKVSVGASKKYEVLIGRGLLAELGRLTAEVKPCCRVALITDDVVDCLYGDRAKKSLEDAGFCVVRYVFKNGERSKDLSTYADILDWLSESGITRTDLIAALGGGVCGDMAGFAAATFLRGLDYIQIPTTLLSMVDSSVGGKTAVDLKAGKNLVGAFHQPIRVICDTETLSTLSEEIFADGASETIKYGILKDRRIFDLFNEGRAKEEIDDIIRRSVEIKSWYVEQDEFDTGLRMYLNLGHTAGHAVEKLSDFSVSHGHAVAIGMVIAADMAASLSLMKREDAELIKDNLKRNGLPVSTPFSAEELGEAALSDKKRMGGSIKLILPTGIGSCCLYETDAKRLPELFGLSEAVGAAVQK